jgi:hypothetical protein
MRAADAFAFACAMSFVSVPAAYAEGAAVRDEAAGSSPHGTPKVALDRLDLSKAPLATADERFLRETLAHEARHVDWGVGRKSYIEYRFRLNELSVTEAPGVVRVSCTAEGWLPKGRPAKSHVSFGGRPNERADLVHRVLQIVARGVLTRLAEIERHRRHVDP